MKKWIIVLSLLLAVQLGLAVTVGLTGERYSAFEPKEKLLAFETQGVDGLRIESADGKLLLSKRKGRWILPESGDFPADQDAVKNLLEKLTALRKGWPLATTGGAARHFKVTDDAFERKLTLLSGEKAAATLYVGTSPGFRKVHVRPAGGDEVYAVAFNAWEANPTADDWIDKGILKLDEKRVQRIEMPGFILQREGESLQLSDLGEQEKSNEEAVRTLVNRLTGLRIDSLLGREAKPEFQQEHPVLEIKLTRDDGEPLSYRFSKPEAGGYYILKRSDLDTYFKVAEFAVNPLKEEAREKLVQLKSEEKPDLSAGNGTAAGPADTGG